MNNLYFECYLHPLNSSRASPKFLATTDTGTILNRFSQDMTLIEGQLPVGVLITVSSRLQLQGIFLATLDDLNPTKHNLTFYRSLHIHRIRSAYRHRVDLHGCLCALSHSCGVSSTVFLSQDFTAASSPGSRKQKPPIFKFPSNY